MSEGENTENTSKLDPPLCPDRYGARTVVASLIYHSPALAFARGAARRVDMDGASLRMRRAASPKFGVLCYHRIGTKGLPLYSALPSEIFEKQIRYVRKHYRVLSLTELCAELNSPQSDRPAISITFDDGYGDLFWHAFPVLKKYSIPATVFLAVDAIETGEVPWYDRIFAAMLLMPGQTLDLEPLTTERLQLGSPKKRVETADRIMRMLRTLPDPERQRIAMEVESKVQIPSDELRGRMLTWDQIREMGRAGIAFGSHTLSHRVMSKITPEAAERELKESRVIIEHHLGAAIDTFAFPFGQPGDIEGITPDLLRRCGYSCAMTTTEGVNRPGSNPFRLKRTQACNDWHVPMFAWKLNKLYLQG